MIYIMKTSKDNPTIPFKRWSIIDTINLTVLLLVALFLKDDIVQEPIMMWVLIIAFLLWIGSVIFRNYYISKLNEKFKDK
ncbi:hypothetical protein ABAL111652_02050 [Abyssicoccus albus]|uniref:Uncharacterized protein n=2 Tax=Abyssicoccus albus TaxID=1817405 RepID=A0A3N5CII7_9BACL|nr:hypothetical protein EDD62_0079 [Abyssicoccus albus]